MRAVNFARHTTARAVQSALTAFNSIDNSNSDIRSYIECNRGIILKKATLLYKPPKSGPLKCCMTLTPEFIEISSVEEEKRYSKVLLNWSIHGLAMVSGHHDLSFSFRCSKVYFMASAIWRDVHTFTCSHQGEVKEWMQLLESVTRSGWQETSSFNPIRRNVSVNYYPNGKSYYSALADVIEAAANEVYISGWWLSPKIYLKRDPSLDENYRLDNLVQRKANEGVLFLFLLYWPPGDIVALNTKGVKKYLQSLSPNVHVKISPNGENIAFSHHQKFVVVDNSIAFLGGIDLCIGRFNVPGSELIDEDEKLFPGYDYYNPTYSKYDNDALTCELKENKIIQECAVDRKHYPRMPWQDSQLSFFGQPARDVALNFIQRWNAQAKRDHRNDQTLIPEFFNPRPSKDDPSHPPQVTPRGATYQPQDDVPPSEPPLCLDPGPSILGSKILPDRHPSPRRSSAAWVLPLSVHSRDHAVPTSAAAAAAAAAAVEARGGDSMAHSLNSNKPGVITLQRSEPSIPTSAGERREGFSLANSLPPNKHGSTTWALPLSIQSQEHLLASAGERRGTNSIANSLNSNNHGVVPLQRSDNSTDNLISPKDQEELYNLFIIRIVKLDMEVVVQPIVQVEAMELIRSNEGDRRILAVKALQERRGYDRTNVGLTNTPKQSWNQKFYYRKTLPGDEIQVVFQVWLTKEDLYGEANMHFSLLNSNFIDVPQHLEVTKSSTLPSAPQVGKLTVLVSLPFVPADKPFGWFYRSHLQPHWMNVDSTIEVGLENLWRTARNRNEAIPVVINSKQYQVNFSIRPLRGVNSEEEIIFRRWPPFDFEYTDVTCQIVRSVDHWSTCGLLECSIHECYLEMIRNSQYFIYIESQFFISDTASGFTPVKNKVASALVARIRRAFEEKQKFRVYIIVPLHPEGNIEDGSVQAILYWQYRTICRDSKTSTCLFSELKKQCPGIEIDKFICFFSLYKYSKLGKNYVGNQIYVHSKILIVDDKVMVVGSQNINDRSLLGSGDSEIAMAVLGQRTNKIDATFSGRKDKVNPIVRNFRLELWQEHLQITPSMQYNYPFLLDPTADYTFDVIWRKTAQINTVLLDQIFPGKPQNSLTTTIAYSCNASQDKDHHRNICKVNGHVILFPLDFLKDKDLRHINDSLFL